MAGIKAYTTGPPRKEGRQRRNKMPEVPLRSPEEAAATKPDPPKNLSERHAAFWNACWSSPLARAWDPKTDLHAIQALFTLYEERDRLDPVYQASILIKSQNDEPKVNPLRDVIRTCDEHICRLEDRFGLNPMSRLRMGLKFDDLPVRERPKRELPVGDPRKILKAVQ